jgi:hypothetical protein
MTTLPTPTEKLNASSAEDAQDRKEAKAYIKKKLDEAVQLMAQAREMLRDFHPKGYIYCEGSGRIYARTGETEDSRDVWVTSKQGRFDAGGW